MIDSLSPIVPGQSAAGIKIGSPIQNVLKQMTSSFQKEEIKGVASSPSRNLTRYRSTMVDIWEENGVVVQVMVHDGYRGKLMGAVGLGSTVAELEAQLGEWEEDEEDNLVLSNFPGMSFEVEGIFSDIAEIKRRNPVIREIYVFKV